MKIAVFTSNQPRHVGLLDALVAAGHEVRAVVEPKTYLLPEQSTLRAYWERVEEAEYAIFPSELVRVPCVALRPGELSLAMSGRAGRDMLERGWHPIVFSSSYITGPFADMMIARGALNLHVGIAPEFRGSAPNAWAHYLGRPDLIGAQVQRLSRGLDAGDILAEVRVGEVGDYFRRSMLAVKYGIEALVALLATPEPWTPIRANDRAQQIRYSRARDFTEDVAAKIMDTA